MPRRAKSFTKDSNTLPLYLPLSILVSHRDYASNSRNCAVKCQVYVRGSMRLHTLYRSRQYEFFIPALTIKDNDRLRGFTPLQKNGMTPYTFYSASPFAIIRYFPKEGDSILEEVQTGICYWDKEHPRRRCRSSEDVRHTDLNPRTYGWHLSWSSIAVEQFSAKPDQFGVR